ncbi:MAG: 16S rRNA (cytidine(1402)-2'-O)-methyltransferase, partial [bacterium]|nr:16S rRNA (cytidine(1402)-2'-O)-methyltransferase [bacterium]
TRKARVLLEKCRIPKKNIISFFEGNEREKTDYVIRRIKEDGAAALITDAGTPCVSDPGYRLVSILRSENVEVIPVPGPCAAIAALSASGIASDRFVFEGYMPKSDKKLRDFFTALKNEQRTLIFYESPKRIRNSLELMLDVWGNRKACLFREMTKLYEESIFGPLSEILNKLGKEPRGEITIVAEGREKTRETDYDFERIVSLIRDETGVGTSKAAKIAAKITGLKKRDIYKAAAGKE